MIKMDLQEIPGEQINKIVVEGAMDTSDNNLITKTVKGGISKGVRFFVVDMSKVSYVNSSGMLDLICCQELLKIHHGSINFFGINVSIQNVLEVVGVSRLISVLPTEEECVKSLLVLVKKDVAKNA